MKTLPKISNIYLITTHSCNLACRYCFVHQGKLEMPLQVAFDAIDFLVANNPPETSSTVYFFGGEPLLKWNDLIVPTVLYTKRKYPNRKIHFSLTTNSVLLDDEKIKFICDNNIYVLTSIDGNNETQDYNRPFHNGAGSSSIVEEHVKKYIATGRKPTFRSTVIPETCHNMFDNYLYANSLGYRSMFMLTDAYGQNWDEEHKEIVFNNLQKIADHYIDYYKKNGKVFLHLSMLERNFMRIFEDIKCEQCGIPIPNRYTENKCGFGQNSCAAVSVSGDLYGCQELVTNEGKKSAFYIGNIYSGVDEDRRLKLLEMFREHPKQGDINCENCIARSICHGGCVSTNYSINGELNHCTAGHCFFYRHCYTVSKKIVEELSDNENFKKEFLSPKNNKNCNQCQLCQNENSEKGDNNVSRTV